jgi:hypothetical protein
MTFLSPWAFSFLAIVPVIVLLYLLKVERRPATVSTLLFWQRILIESRRRSLFQKLRRLLSLLLHLLIFMLLLLALARPDFTRFLKDGSSTVLILDTRARMQAIEPDGDSRFEKAKRLASTFAGRIGTHNQMTLLLAFSPSEVAAPFTSDEKAMLGAVASVMPSDAGGDLSDAIRLAGELLASRPGAHRVVVFTDGTEATENKTIEFVSVGTPLDNVAITRFGARRLPNSPQTWELMLEVRNFGESAVDENVEIRLDNRLLDVKPCRLDPGEKRLEFFELTPPKGPGSHGWLTARLDKPDALAADNEAYATIPALQPLRVLLVTKGNWFIEKMLAADESLEFELLAPDAYRAEMTGAFDAVILDDFLPHDFDLQTARGNFLFIKNTPFPTAAAPLERPIITETEAGSPLFRFVNLSNVTILRANALRLPESSDEWRLQAPLRSFDNALAITGERRLPASGQQRVCAFAFDATQSDLPLRVAFPLLMSNTLQWLAGDKSRDGLALRAGQMMELALDETVTKASNETKPRVTNVFRPMHNGFYTTERNGKRSWIAVNTFSDEESDLRGANANKRVAPARLPSHAAAALRAWPPWIYLTLIALALFSLEWWLYHRRHTE